MAMRENCSSNSRREMKARTATGRGQVAKFTLIQKGDLQGRSGLPGVGAERAESQLMAQFLSLVTG